MDQVKFVEDSLTCMVCLGMLHIPLAEDTKAVAFAVNKFSREFSLVRHTKELN